MAIDSRRRARQLAKKAAKRKAQLAIKRREGMFDNTRQFARIADFPTHESLMPSGLFETGIGDVILSRKMGDTVYAGVFLVDVYCLGVKNAFLSMVSQADYRIMVARFREREDLIPIEPSCARRLVEEAVDYAGALGFEPHKDYKKAKEVFGKIDAAACPARFKFGKDGKPLFVSGPNDSQTKCDRIMATLNKRCGPDGFHYIVGLGPWDLDDQNEEESDVEG